MTMLSAQLNKQGKKKRIKSKTSLDSYLNDKFDLFLNTNSSNFMNQDQDLESEAGALN